MFAGAAFAQPERFKTGAGKELKMIAAEAHEAESIFGGLWPELSRLGKLLAGYGGPDSVRKEIVEEDKTEIVQPTSEGVSDYWYYPEPPQETIHLYPPGCFPKGKPLTGLLEADSEASGQCAKRVKRMCAPE